MPLSENPGGTLMVPRAGGCLEVSRGKAFSSVPGTDLPTPDNRTRFTPLVALSFRPQFNRSLHVHSASSGPGVG